MSVIKKAKKRYANRNWVKAHKRAYSKLIYDRDFLNRVLEAMAGYKMRHR